METPEDIAELIRANWGSKTLADFRLVYPVKQSVTYSGCGGLG